MVSVFKQVTLKGRLNDPDLAMRNPTEHPSRFRQLLLPEEHERKSGDRQLAKQCNPKPAGAESSANADGKVGEDIAGASIIGCEGAGTDGCHRTNHLSCNKSKGDMKSRERLEEHHSEACRPSN